MLLLSALPLATPIVYGVSVVGGLGYRALSGPLTLGVVPAFDGLVAIHLVNLPSTTIAGWTFVSADAAPGYASGPFLGITPDALTLSLFLAFPTATAGNPFHFVAGVQGAFPDASHVFPAGTASLLAGTTLDWVSVSYDATPAIDAVSNIIRRTF